VRQLVVAVGILDVDLRQENLRNTITHGLDNFRKCISEMFFLILKKIKKKNISKGIF